MSETTLPTRFRRWLVVAENGDEQRRAYMRPMTFAEARDANPGAMLVMAISDDILIEEV